MALKTTLLCSFYGINSTPAHSCILPLVLNDALGNKTANIRRKLEMFPLNRMHPRSEFKSSFHVLRV